MAVVAADPGVESLQDPLDGVLARAQGAPGPSNDDPAVDPLDGVLSRYGASGAIPAVPGPKPKPTVTVGPVQPLGIPASEIARLRTTGPLAQRIEFSLRSARAAEGRPDLGRSLDQAMDQATPMSFGRGLMELAMNGAFENLAPTKGQADADAIVEKLARSGVDVSKHATALGLARAGGNFGGNLALGAAPGGAELSAALEGAPRVAKVGAHMLQAGAQNAAVTAAGSAAEGDDTKTTLRNVGESFGAGAALSAALSEGAREMAGEFVSHFTAPSESSSGRPLTGSRARVRPGSVPVPEVPPTPTAGDAIHGIAPIDARAVAERDARAKAREGLPIELDRMTRPGATGRRIGAVGDISKIAEEPERPVGEGATFPERLYSRLGQAIEAAPFEKGTPAQWRAALEKGVSKGEREWVGLERYLHDSNWEDKPNQTLTRAEVRDVFEGGRIRLGEVTHQDDAHLEAQHADYRRALADQNTALDQLHHAIQVGHLPTTRVLEILRNKAGDPVETERLLADAGVMAADVPRVLDAGNAYRRASVRVAAFPPNGPHVVPPKFSSYTEPGGENYREHLITLVRPPSPVAENFATWAKRERPAMTGDEVTQAFRSRSSPEYLEWFNGPTGPDAGIASGQANFRTNHWDTPNVLVHVRTKDRTLPSGERALYVEEMQSDWHQKGRRLGYRTGIENPRIQEIRAKLADLDAREEVLMQGPGEWQTAPGRLSDERYRALKGERDALNQERYDLESAEGAKVPNAPFKKTEEWTQLGLKKVIDEAARGGYDRVVWTTGEQQARRYDLSRQVDRLQYDPASGMLIARKNGGIVHEGKYDARALPDVIGKEAADRLLATPLSARGPLEDLPAAPHHALSGVDLKVGGEGQRAYYDKILPNTLRDYAKRLGVKIDVEPVGVAPGARWAKASGTPIEANDIRKLTAVAAREGNQQVAGVLHGFNADDGNFEGDGSTVREQALNDLPPDAHAFLEANGLHFRQPGEELTGEWVARAGGPFDHAENETGQIGRADVDQSIEVAREMRDDAAEGARLAVEGGAEEFAYANGLVGSLQQLRRGLRRNRPFGEALDRLSPDDRAAVVGFMEIEPERSGPAPGQRNLSFKVTPELKEAIRLHGQPLGFTHEPIGRAVAGAGVGAAVGGLQGDTPEEHKRNMILGAGIGMAAAAGIPTVARAVVKRWGKDFTQGFTDIYAPIRAEAPALHAALHAAGAMPPISAARFVGGLAARSLKHLTPAQRETFGRRILMDNFEAEATRQTKAAEFARREASSEPTPEDPKKSRRGLWYSQKTEGGTLRAPEEMETGPLLDEFARRIEASRTYHAVQNLRKYGPGSVVTIRNERKIWDIHDLLTTRDGLDSSIVWAEGERRALEQKTGEPQEEDLAIDFERHEPAEKASETTIRANLMQQAADRFRNLASSLRQRLPANVEQEPWFRTALDKAKMNVQGFNEAGAIGAGVEVSAFRKPSLGLYMRLMNETRMQDKLLRTAQAVEARRPGATQPRTGLALKVLGQKPAAVRSMPAGAEGPLQGPVDTRREKTAMGNLPRGTAISPAVQHATGEARNYVDNFETAARADAEDKVAKMARNSVYREIAKIPDAELGADRDAPPHQRVLVFNDMHELVPPAVQPKPGEPLPKGFRRFAVSPEIYHAVEQFHRQVGGGTGIGRVARFAAGVVTRSVLLNPAAAMGHALTLGSSVGTSLPADAGFARAALTRLPGIKVASTLRRMAKVDFDNPETVLRLHRLALEGGLRISPDEQRGWLNAGHHILFGPSGIDPRARIIASEDFEAGARRAGLTPKDPAFAALERDYIVAHAGNYVGRNSGAAQQFLQDAGIAPFIAINRAKYGTALKAVVGATGIPKPSLATRAGVVAGGPVGTALALVGAGYLLSGHSAAQNAPGHETDMATGVYHLPDAAGNYALAPSAFRYFRGSPDEARKQFGPRAKEIYVKKGTVDPVSAAGIRLLEPIATAAPGDKVSELVRASANAALGLVGPAPAAAFGLATGKGTYIDRDGALGSIQGIHLNKDADIVDRLLAATRNVNAGAALAIPGQTGGARSGTAALLGNLNPFAESVAGTAPRDATDRREFRTWQDDAVGRIFGERDRAKRLELVEQLVKEANDAGFAGTKLRSTFQKAANRAGVDRSEAARRRFLNQIKGAAAPVTVPSAKPDEAAADPLDRILSKHKPGGGE